MKRFKWILALFFLMSMNIYASPADENLELTATLCHFSDLAFKCSCAEEAKEHRNEQKKLDRKVRKENR